MVHTLLDINSCNINADSVSSMSEVHNANRLREVYVKSGQNQNLLVLGWNQKC